MPTPTLTALPIDDDVYFDPPLHPAGGSDPDSVPPLQPVEAELPTATLPVSTEIGVSVPRKVKTGQTFLHPYCGPNTWCAAAAVTLVFWPALCCCIFPGCKCDQVLLKNEDGEAVYAGGEYDGAVYRSGCCEF